jgi:hypothetical protein
MSGYNITQLPTVQSIFFVDDRLTFFTIQSTDASETYRLFSISPLVTFMQLTRPRIITPRRLRNFFVATIEDQVISCFDDSLHLFVNSKEDGRVLPAKVNKEYRNEPYTEKELATFSPEKRFLVESYDPYGPVIQGLYNLDDKRVVLVRAQRPLDSDLKVDLILKERQDFTTFVLKLPRDKQFQSAFCNNSILYLVLKDSARFYISKVTFHL